MTFARQESEGGAPSRFVLVVRGALANFAARSIAGAVCGVAVSVLIGSISGHFKSLVRVLLFVVGASLMAAVGCDDWSAVRHVARGDGDPPQRFRTVPRLRRHARRAAAHELAPPTPAGRRCSSLGRAAHVRPPRSTEDRAQGHHSNLGYRAPHTIPFSDGDAWAFYDPRLWEALFPPEVMRHLVAASKRCLVSARRDDPSFAKTIELVQERHGLLILPQSELPVLVAVRLSLSFPVLLSAVPLSFVDPSDRRSSNALLLALRRRNQLELPGSLLRRADRRAHLRDQSRAGGAVVRRAARLGRQDQPRRAQTTLGRDERRP